MSFGTTEAAALRPAIDVLLIEVANDLSVEAVEQDRLSPGDQRQGGWQGRIRKDEQPRCFARAVPIWREGLVEVSQGVDQLRARLVAAVQHDDCAMLQVVDPV